MNKSMAKKNRPKYPPWFPANPYEKARGESITWTQYIWACAWNRAAQKIWEAVQKHTVTRRKPARKV